MAKAKQRRPAQPARPNNSARPTKKPAVSGDNGMGAHLQQKEVVEQIYEQAVAGAIEEDIGTLTAADVNSDQDLSSLIRKASEAYQLLQRQIERAEEAERANREQRDNLESWKQELEALDRSLGARRATLDADSTKLTNWEKELTGREENALSGFRTQHQEALKQLRQDKEHLEAAVAALRERLLQIEADHDAAMAREETARDEAHRKRRAELEAEYQRRHDAQQEEFGRQRSALDEEWSGLRAAQASLRTEKRRLVADEANLQEDRAHFDVRVQASVAAALQQAQQKYETLEAQLQIVTERRDELEGEVLRRQEADRRFGHRSPDQILAELDSLREERKRLLLERNSLPDAQALDRLRVLEEASVQWQNDRAVLQEKLSKANARLERYQVEVIAVESLRDQCTALSASRDLLQKAVAELDGQVKELTHAADNRVVFKECTNIDSDDRYQSTPELDERPIDLKRFSDDLRHAIAGAFKDSDGVTLYYSGEDIRSFLGGLAMSRLMLLQGISGIGKTSLPRAFAKAIGAGLSKIEVQAGWRDRYDLFGHFNSYEHRYYEKRFLLALYEAQSPTYRSRPYIVILDEMNLSHPEQYFADVLSVISDSGEKYLDVIDTAVTPTPRCFRDGRRLPLPDNIWFIGTANHDETTVDFAPKTRDRAHVLELPNDYRAHAFTVKPPSSSRLPVAWGSLRTAFEKARLEYTGDAQRTIAFLDSLRTLFGECFAIGWGNRLEEQLRDYVPVVRACGGSIGEATDYILSTKLIGKIKESEEVRVEDLKDLDDALDAGWQSLGGVTPPSKAHAAIRAERRRLGARD